MAQEQKRWNRPDAQIPRRAEVVLRAGMTGAPPDAATQPDYERLLLEAAERALRAPAGKVALALHLSRLRPPAPRFHHIRIARALLQDTAQRHGGQIFPLRNGDLVLLCGSPVENGAVTGPTAAAALPASLARLFGGEAPDRERLTSFWRLETEGEGLWQFLHQRRDGQGHVAPPDESSIATDGLLPLEACVAAAQVADLLTQQTAIQLLPGRDLPLSTRLAPLFRELSVSLKDLASTQEAAEALEDPYVFRHFASRLDLRLLEHVREDLGQGGKLTRFIVRNNLPLHLNLALESVVSQEFARLSDAAGRTGARFGVEISLMEAAADPALMEYAARLLRIAGFPLIVDALDPAALTLSHPAGLRPAMVKLVWSPRLADPPPQNLSAIEAAIARIGADRIVLLQADTEAALVWGQTHGIKRFQGFFLDAVQAAGRIGVCHSARACTLRQCITRAASLSPPIRVGCGNPALLERGPPRPAIDEAAQIVPLTRPAHADHPAH